ncbi:hypothetical protein PMI28_04957, partial [Pseudomonas sp. GM48]
MDGKERWFNCAASKQTRGGNARQLSNFSRDPLCSSCRAREA